jgi:hypothetical protein
MFLLGCYNVFSTELEIRLSFVKTSEFRGGLNLPHPYATARRWDLFM